MYEGMFVWMIQKQSSLSLYDVANIDVSLFLTLFFLGGVLLLLVWLWIISATSGRMIVSLIQMVSQKKFVPSVWYKQDELRFTMVSEYYRQKCFLTRPNVPVLLLRRLLLFQPICTWRRFQEETLCTFSFSLLLRERGRLKYDYGYGGEWPDLVLRVL